MAICRNSNTSTLFAKLANPLVCFIIILVLLYVGQDILKPLAFSCLLALLFVSPCAFFERQGFPRGLAAMVVLLFGLIVFVIIFYFISNSNSSSNTNPTPYIPTLQNIEYSNPRKPYPFTIHVHTYTYTYTYTHKSISYAS